MYYSPHRDTRTNSVHAETWALLAVLGGLILGLITIVWVIVGAIV